MVDRISEVLWRRMIPRLVLAAVAPLLLAAGMGCSGVTPTPAPTTIAPPPPATPVVPGTNASTSSAPYTATPTVLPALATESPRSTVAPTEEPQLIIDVRPFVVAAASDLVYGLLEELVAELGHRVSGSEEELRAAELLKQRYESMGLEVEIQSFARNSRFDFGRWFISGGENGAVVVESEENLRFPGLPITTTPATTRNSGPLLTLDLREGESLPQDGIAGKVVHIVPGRLDPSDWQAIQRMHDRIDLLADAGAVAAVISQSEGEHIQFPISQGVEFSIPALFLHQTDHARQLIDLAAEEDDSMVSVRIEAERLESRNVVAELPGMGDGIVVVGAHYDIAPETRTGANDNTSGVAVVLSLAQSLQGKQLPFSVRFVMFGAEEVGLLGSRHYVASLSDTELERVKAMLNFDVVGSGGYTAVSGDSAIVEEALTLAEELQVRAQTGFCLREPAAITHHSRRRVCRC